ncbi:DUF1298 domain-containing protein [Mycolicibacterium phlei]
MRDATTMAPVDAFWYWLSLRIPNDQFLLYAFDGAPPDLEQAVAAVRRRALAQWDFQVRIADRRRLRYPVWERCGVADEQFVVHGSPGDWAGCLKALTALMDDGQLDATVAAWRVHVFPDVAGVPSAPRPATVAVVQMSHALGDGGRSSALAAYLFGRTDPLPAVHPQRVRWFAPRTAAALRWARVLERDTEAGTVPPELPPVRPLSSNRDPEGDHELRTIVVPRSALPGASVTVGAMSAIGEALGGVLRERGEDPSQLTTQLLVAHRGERTAHNHFGSAPVRLHPDVGSASERARLIQVDLANWQRRQQHYAFTAERLAFDAMPAVVRRWGTARANFDARPAEVPYNTVVSSVNRGPADLCLGDRPVILTSGYPAIFPMMGLTHGVHGIGDAVAISVHTAPNVIPDVDDYMDRLRSAAVG